MKKVLSIFSGMLIILCIFIEYAYYTANKVIIKERSTNIVISEDDDIATKLVQANLTDNVLVTRCILFYMSQFKNMKYNAGEYKIPNKYTLLDIVNKMDQHEIIIHNIIIYRGSNICEIKDRINARSDLSGEITIPFNEGDIIAGKYEFIHPTSKNELILKMLRYSKTAIENIWKQRSKFCAVSSIQDLKILASVIAKEANYEPSEIQLISGVFRNRLKIGMPLQADSTLVYYRKIVDNSNRMTYRQFMATDHPYNTYRTRGLPPTPISTPSREELMAVAMPVETEYLYFQHDIRNGDVFFSKDFSRHLKIQKMLMKMKEGNKQLKNMTLKTTS